MHSLHIAPDLVVDHRRAAWLPNERILAVADLHLGYAWAHRLSGQLMPIPPAGDTLSRLAALQTEYDPVEIVVLGDIVHRAMNIPALESELRDLVTSLSPKSRLTFLAGNHDRALQQVVDRWGLHITLASHRSAGSYLLLHGEAPPPADFGSSGSARPSRKARACVLMGHEHPAISIGDGVTTSQKCPCFLVGEHVVVMPAFSTWAAGTNIRSYPMMSELARNAKFTRAIAICGERLLSIPL